MFAIFAKRLSETDRAYLRGLALGRALQAAAVLDPAAEVEGFALTFTTRIPDAFGIAKRERFRVSVFFRDREPVLRVALETSDVLDEDGFSLLAPGATIGALDLLAACVAAVADRAERVAAVMNWSGFEAPEPAAVAN